MIIGMSGYARSGKDTVADFLVKNHGFVKLSFATPMREALIRLDPMIRIGDRLTVSLSQALSSMSWEDLKSVSPDVRPLMQKMGTEVGRQLIGENVWVDLAMKEAEKHENVVFADCRFKNEAGAIWLRKGVLWRMERDGVGPTNGHISETDLDGAPAIVTLYNRYPLEELEGLVTQAFEMTSSALDG